VTELPGVRGSMEDLARAISMVVEMPSERREAMGAAGRRRCDERYSWTAIAERLEDIYDDALSRRGPGVRASA
jgi:glycosyltransferase involved in cell wall biosynthesis